MRRLVGCCGGVFVVLCALLCVGGGVLSFTGAAGAVAAAAPLQVGETAAPFNPPKQESDALAASYNQKTADFSRQLVAGRASNQPATLTLTRQEVMGRFINEMKDAVASNASTQGDIGLLLDFQNDRAIATIFISNQGQKIELRLRLNLTPRDTGFEVDIERADVFGLFPFPINVTPFISAAMDQQPRSDRIFDTPFRPQSVTMRDGTITIVALPK